MRCGDGRREVSGTHEVEVPQRKFGTKSFFDNPTSEFIFNRDFSKDFYDMFREKLKDTFNEETMNSSMHEQGDKRRGLHGGLQLLLHKKGKYHLCQNGYGALEQTSRSEYDATRCDAIFLFCLALVTTNAICGYSTRSIYTEKLMTHDKKDNEIIRILPQSRIIHNRRYRHTKRTQWRAHSYLVIFLSNRESSEVRQKLNTSNVAKTGGTRTTTSCLKLAFVLIGILCVYETARQVERSPISIGNDLSNPMALRRNNYIGANNFTHYTRWQTNACSLDGKESRCFDPLHGTRIGEAANPGPYHFIDGAYNMLQSTDPDDSGNRDRGNIKLITTNVASLNPKVAVVAKWDADVTMMQETKATASALADLYQNFRDNNKQLVHGIPCKPVVKKAKTYAPIANGVAAKGGVAISIRQPRTLSPISPSQLTKELQSTGRWAEVMIPTKGSTNHMGAATVYGIPRAASDTRCYQENEIILSKAILRMIEAGDIPYILMGDININLADSEAIASAVQAGILVDVAFATRNGCEPSPTYRRSGPYEGMTEDEGNVSRIDVILANPVAAAAVTSFNYRWDLTVSDHVPLEVNLALGSFEKSTMAFDGPSPIKTDGIPDKVPDRIKEAAYDKAKQMTRDNLTHAIEQADVDLAHQAWSDTAELYIDILKGKDEQEAWNDIVARPRRCDPPNFACRRVAAPTNSLAEPTSLRQRQLYNLKNKCNEINAKMERWKRQSPSEHDLWGINAANAEEKRKTLDTWAKIKILGPKILGTAPGHERPEWESPTPSADDLSKIIGIVKATCHEEQLRKNQRIASERKAAIKWDLEKNHARRAFARIRADYRPPTVSTRDPESNGRFTFDQCRLHHLFTSDWKKIYRKHARSPPDINKFIDRYGKHIPNAPLPQDFEINETDLLEQAARMRPSGHGFDGWTVAAIKLLPIQAWRDRVVVEKMARCQRKFPQGYYHAPNVMLPKAEGDSPLKHRGITVFSVLHRCLGGAYWRKLQPWQEQWLPPTLHGARGGGRDFI